MDSLRVRSEDKFSISYSVTKPTLIATLQVKSVLDAKLKIHMKAEYEACCFETPVKYQPYVDGQNG